MAAGSEPTSDQGEERVSLVLVSHSRQLAEGVAELSRAMAGEEVKVVAAGGMEPPETALGTDASRVAAAIQRAWSNAGVLVLMDLGSALLSTEMALEFISEELRDRVRLTSAPLVEGAVAAAVAARLGLSLDQVQAEAQGALGAKAAQLGGGEPDPAATREVTPAALPEALEVEVAVDLPLGLHARPASRVVRATAGLEATVLASNASTGQGPVSAASFNALARLQIRSGQRLRIQAQGKDAEKVVGAIRSLAERRFDEPREEPLAPLPNAVVRPPAREGELAGLAASPGTAIGPVQMLVQGDFEIPEHSERSSQEELARLEVALDLSRDELAALARGTRASVGPSEAAIVEALALFLDDAELLEPTRAAIARGGIPAERAWADQVALIRSQWETTDDARMRLRAADLEGVSRKVLGHLCGTEPSSMSGAGILVAAELTPTDTAGLDRSEVLGLATAGGGPTSHSAILARAMGIPAVVGLGPRVLDLDAGSEVLLDGDRGVLVIAPSLEQRGEGRARAEAARAAQGIAQARAQEPAVTRDGTLVRVVANLGSVAEAEAARQAGADGVGLLRTEFLFLSVDSMPDIETQSQAYADIAVALEGRPITIRTLDVGADKHLAYVSQPTEENPALGLRGLRLGLDRPELLESQLRAVARVAQKHPLRLMFPMVSTLSELLAARRVLDQALAAEHLRDEDLELEVGIMIEVPAAALSAPALARSCEFFSLGTNDLSQYALAADRTNAGVSALADAFHPAVLRLIAATVAGARPRGREVAVCGELAGLPGAAELLVGLGIRELSVAVPLLAGVKQAVRQVELPRARSLARRALGLADAEAVRSLLSSRPTG